MDENRLEIDNTERTYEVGFCDVRVEVTFVYDTKRDEIVARLEYDDVSGHNVEFYLGAQELLRGIQLAATSINYDIEHSSGELDQAELIVVDKEAGTLLVQDSTATLCIGMHMSYCVRIPYDRREFPAGMWQLDMFDLRAMFEYTFAKLFGR